MLVGIIKRERFFPYYYVGDTDHKERDRDKERESECYHDDEVFF